MPRAASRCSDVDVQGMGEAGGTGRARGQLGAVDEPAGQVGIVRDLGQRVARVLLGRSSLRTSCSLRLALHPATIRLAYEVASVGLEHRVVGEVGEERAGAGAE